MHGGVEVDDVRGCLRGVEVGVEALEEGCFAGAWGVRGSVGEGREGGGTGHANDDDGGGEFGIGGGRRGGGGGLGGRGGGRGWFGGHDGLWW